MDALTKAVTDANNQQANAMSIKASPPPPDMSQVTPLAQQILKWVDDFVKTDTYAKLAVLLPVAGVKVYESPVIGHTPTLQRGHSILLISKDKQLEYYGAGSLTAALSQMVCMSVEPYPLTSPTAFAALNIPFLQDVAAFLASDSVYALISTCIPPPAPR